MDKVWEDAIRYLAAMGGVMVGWWGGWSAGSKVLVILMVVDYVSGCACALTGHSAKTESGHFWSQVAVAGILKKVFTMAVILMAALLDQVLSGGSGAENSATMFRSAAEFFYIATEGLSIVENVGLMGVPVPKPLRQALEVLRDKGDKEDD
ncbi:MAG: phage holin family protein [bacterium]